MALAAAIRAIGILAWLLMCLLPCWIVYLTRSRQLQGRTQQWLFAVVASIMNLHVTRHGNADDARPLLLVTNHLSYLDVLVIGSTTPVHFTPKAEIARWPLIGFFCKLAGCIFIDRRRSRTEENRGQLQQALDSGARLCLFPEGTTSDGASLQRFRSSYFELAERGGLTIQCAAVRYDRLNGEELEPHQPNPVAWHGDADFFPHFWWMLKQRRVDASLTFLPAMNEADSRKALAQRSEQLIRSELGLPQLPAV